MKRVLVCVLDWGLGHATRSIPVIRELQRQGAQVILASSRDAGLLLRQEFPALDYHELPGYSPVYQSEGSLLLTLASQGFKFAAAIRQEHRWVEELVRRHQVNLVISDNRFGCFSAQVPSVFVTHQYQVRLPNPWSVAERLVNRWLASHYNNYQHVWVPDQPDSGLTSPFVPVRAPVTHVGWLSRFAREGDATPGWDLVATVSGPEPQRKKFADQLTRELAASGQRALLVTGQPGAATREERGRVEIVNHLPAKNLEQALRGADVIIARSGYSTIMDLIALGKRAVLVPTPQQPEQILLARKLHEWKVAFCPDQQNFTVEKALQEVRQVRGFGFFTMEHGLLQSAIRNVLS